MAPLILESARAARTEAERVRSASFELRTAVRQSNRLAHARTAKAAAATAASEGRRRAMTLASPWSALEWLPQDEELGRVLVLLD